MWKGIRSAIAGVLRWVEHIEAIEWILKQIGWRDAVSAVIISSGLTGWWHWLSDVPAPLLVAFWLFVALVVIGLIIGFRWIFDRQLSSNQPAEIRDDLPAKQVPSGPHEPSDSGTPQSEPQPDLNAAEGFKTILARSKWVKETGARISADQMADELSQKLHDLLHQNQLTAWGRRPGNNMPQKRILAVEWEKIEISFDPRTLNATAPDGQAAHPSAWTRDNIRNRKLAYVEIRFSIAQLYGLFASA